MARQFAVDQTAGIIEIRCVWCGQITRDWTVRMFQGQACVCPCGAMGLFAPPHDFDEAAEELLQGLHIDGDVAKPATPVGDSGMVSARAYDGAWSRQQLAGILAARGLETLAEDAELVISRPGTEELRVTSWGLWWRSPS